MTRRTEKQAHKDEQDIVEQASALERRRVLLHRRRAPDEHRHGDARTHRHDE